MARRRATLTSVVTTSQRSAAKRTPVEGCSSRPRPASTSTVPDPQRVTNWCLGFCRQSECRIDRLEEVLSRLLHDLRSCGVLAAAARHKARILPPSVPPPVPADLDTMPVGSSETSVVDEPRGPEQDHDGQHSAPVQALDLCAHSLARHQGGPDAAPSCAPLGPQSPRGHGVSDNAFPSSPDLQRVLAGLSVLFSNVERTLQMLSQRVHHNTESIGDVRSRLQDPEALPALADRVLALESQEDDSLHKSDLVMRQLLREYDDVRTRLKDAGTTPALAAKIRSLETVVGRHTDDLGSLASELATLTNLIPTESSVPLPAFRDDIYMMMDSFSSQHAQLRADLTTVYEGHHQLANALQSSHQAHQQLVATIDRRSANARWVLCEHRLHLLDMTSVLLAMLWRRDRWRPTPAAS